MLTQQATAGTPPTHCMYTAHACMHTQHTHTTYEHTHIHAHMLCPCTKNVFTRVIHAQSYSHEINTHSYIHMNTNTHIHASKHASQCASRQHANAERDVRNHADLDDIVHHHGHTSANEVWGHAASHLAQSNEAHSLGRSTGGGQRPTHTQTQHAQGSKRTLKLPSFSLTPTRHPKTCTLGETSPRTEREMERAKAKPQRGVPREVRIECLAFLVQRWKRERGGGRD